MTLEFTKMARTKNRKMVASKPAIFLNHVQLGIDWDQRLKDEIARQNERGTWQQFVDGLELKYEWKK